MRYTRRKKPYSLLVFEALKKRMKLEKKDYYRFLNLLKGYEGEYSFDLVIDRLTGCIILKDLSLTMNGVDFQIDTLIITPEAVILYEVKNYEGEYIYHEEFLYKVDSKIEVINPLLRLTRSKLLLKQLLKQLHFGNLPVRGIVVFVNPNFTLYEAPQLETLIMPTNIESHVEQIQKELGDLPKSCTVLADQLSNLNHPENHYHDLPQYEYDTLQKGMTCMQCESFVKVIEQRSRSMTCKKCGCKELMGKAIIRHAQELQLLFPERKLTISAVQDWCGGLPSSKRIQTEFRRTYQSNSTRRWRYYT